MREYVEFGALVTAKACARNWRACHKMLRSLSTTVKVKTWTI
jgi:hypothetical protein